jgi:transposase
MHAGFPLLDPGRRRLEYWARALGFADLATFLTDRYVGKEHSLLAIADELGTTPAVVTGLRDGLGVQSHLGIRARGRSRQAGNEQAATASAAALGFDDLRGYLVDRFTTKGWTLSQIAAELGVGEKVVKRLRRALAVTRHLATPRVAAAAQRGRARQAELAARRRQARLAELGFDDLAGYLADRVGRGWSLRRVRAELHVNAAWLRAQVVPLDIPRRARP